MTYDYLIDATKPDMTGTEALALIRKAYYLGQAEAYANARKQINQADDMLEMLEKNSTEYANS